MIYARGIPLKLSYLKKKQISHHFLSQNTYSLYGLQISPAKVFVWGLSKHKSERLPPTAQVRNSAIFFSLILRNSGGLQQRKFQCRFHETRSIDSKVERRNTHARSRAHTHIHIHTEFEDNNGVVLFQVSIVG
jgi:hypothetical protein